MFVFLGVFILCCYVVDGAVVGRERGRVGSSRAVGDREVGFGAGE